MSSNPTASFSGHSHHARTCHEVGICMHPTEQCSGACQQGRIQTAQPHVHDYSLVGDNQPFDAGDWASLIGSIVLGFGGLALFVILAVSAWARWFA